MQLWESVTIALRALTANKLRTILTMLGIIIGVGAVIALISIGSGFRDQINRDFSSLGTNVMWIASGRFNIFGPPESSSRSANQRPPQPLTLADAEALADPLQVSDVVNVAPEYNPGVNTVVRGQTEMNTEVTGVTAEYEVVRNFGVEFGQFITEDDVNRRARVAVLGAQVAGELFEAYEYPLGETVRLQGISFEVVGVLEEKGQSGFGPSQDNLILIPITTAQTRLGSSGAYRGSLIVSSISLQATSPERMDAISEQVTDLMRQRHRLAEDELDDFTITSQSQLLEFGNTFATGLTLFLGSIAGIALLVGGIGIMNIMLVSVTERTREIGIRKAVGAKRRDIMLQFLVESIVLSLLGGFIGIGLGYSISKLIPLLLPNFISATVVTLDSILLASGFAAVVGLFFGVYPATRAARLKPIEALRYE